MSQSKLKRSSVLKQRSKHKEVSELTVKDLEVLADDAVIRLFNAFSASVRKQPARSTFTFKTGDVGRARRVVSGWAPQSYESEQARREFDVPYVLSNFFNRYISASEMDSEKDLQAKAARKFLETNMDGVAIDDYVLEHPMMAPVITKMRRLIGELFVEPFQVTELYHMTGHGPNSTTTIAFRDAYLHNKNVDLKGTKASLQQLCHYHHWDFQLHDIVVEHSDGHRAFLNAWEIPNENVVDYTETSFVPKSFDSLRTMCPEPTVVAFFSQMMAKYLTRLLLKVNIDLRTQPEVHKRLAKLASQHAELFIATIDWSQASDRIWTLLVRAVMSEGNAPQFYRFMENVCRVGNTRVKFSGTLGKEGDFGNRKELEIFLAEHTDTFEIKLDKRQKNVYHVTCFVETTMFATMGNPITFPLQTLIFWAFLTACTEIHCEENGGDINDYHIPTSFGDDGIVDARAYPVIRHYARLLNWKLNDSKSFHEGGFRESCGGDYFSGRYCRPFQPKRPPLDHHLNFKQNLLRYQAWLYILANNTVDLCNHLAGSASDIEAWLLYEHRVAGLGRVCVVPPSYPDGSGLRVSRWYEGLRSDILEHFWTRGPKEGRFVWGLGFDGPQLTFASPVSDEDKSFAGYHKPFYSWTDRQFYFRSITSDPRSLELQETDPQHYYHRVLKASYQLCDGDELQGIPIWLAREEHITLPDYKPPLSFFDMGVKEESAIQGDGTIPIKECYLRKKQVSTAFWQ